MQFHEYCTINCTAKHNNCTIMDNLYNIVQNLVQFLYQTHFSVVQLFKLFMEYNLLYIIVQLM